jgi:peptide/nickel transport system substrate-binding protein
MSSISRREFLRLSSVAVAGVVLTACGQKATPTTAPAAETKPEVKRPTTWPLGQVARGHTLVYSYGGVPAGNHGAYPSAYNHQLMNAVLYEPAAFYAAHADKTYMWLAESFKYNADATQCTITFRKGIKWSDGTAFSAQHVKWSMETLKRVPGLNRAGTYTSELDGVDVVDDNTITVKLNQTDWRFFFKSLTFRFDLGDDTAIQPAHIYSTMKDEELAQQKFFDVAKGWPVSTGPYGVVESTDQLCVFDLRPTWWAVESGFVKSYPDVWKIQVTPFTNDTIAAQQLINDEIDQSLDLRPLVVMSLVQSDHLQSWTSKPPYGYTDWWPISVQFCTMKPPFDNPKVRWAVAYALDQQKVVDVGWAGAGLTANAPFPHFKKLDEYMDGIKDITDKYNVLEFNLDKSAALMTEAGFTKDKDGFWADKDGNYPDADLYAATPLFGDIAPIVAEQLRTAGFKCEHKVPPDVWAAKVDGRASMFLFGHGGSTTDPWDTFNLYHSAPKPMGEQDWGNITRWVNADFNAVTDQMNNTAMDDPKMKDLFKQGMQIYYEQLPDCPLVQWFHRIPVNNTYFKNWPTAENPYMNSALWHLTALQVVLGLQATGKA